MILEISCLIIGFWGLLYSVLFIALKKRIEKENKKYNKLLDSGKISGYFTVTAKTSDWLTFKNIHLINDVNHYIEAQFLQSKLSNVNVTVNNSNVFPYFEKFFRFRNTYTMFISYVFEPITAEPSDDELLKQERYEELAERKKKRGN
jgi:hypothetical protein